MMKCIVLLMVLMTITSALGLTTFAHDRKTSHHKQYNSGKSAYSSSAKTAYSSSSSSGAHGSEQVLRNDQVMMKDGAYRYDYETSNGIQGNEQGVGGVSVQGSNSYISPEGVEVKMSYTADETGYHPVGDHIPQIPDYILRALEYIRLHPSKEQQDTYSHSGSAKNHNYRSVSTPKLSTSISPPHRSSAAGRNSKNNYRG